MNLALRTVRSALVGVLLLCLLVFLPAGTLAYWQGWLFIAAFTIFTNLIGVYLALKNPALLERRIKAGPAAETRPIQKVLISFVYVCMLGLVIVSALDHRLGWSHAPAWISILGNVLVALGLMINLLVLRENSYSASTIQTMPGQKVITTGPYALVRHPMYCGALILVAGAPLALGSYWGLLFLLLTTPVLIFRILDEEKMLESSLGGYDSYKAKVGYRLVPGVW
ncbi:MAG: isoprenylcysteine carboxylmethyltransferase family protein [Candidatus Methylacidiphilaceae bacterium]